MVDRFLENEKDGFPICPTEDIWSARDDQMRRMIDAALLNAQLDTNSEGKSYMYTSDRAYFRSLVNEMERCFRAGCWISVVCLGGAAVDAFSKDIFGDSRCKTELEKMQFPRVGQWQLLRDKRNSIMHINENTDHDTSNNYDLHEYAKQSIFFVYYYFDAINYCKQANKAFKRN